MRSHHLTHLHPGCPVCRVGLLAARDTDDLHGDGVLACDQPACGARHPVIDGVPVIVPDLGGVASNQVLDLAGAGTLTSEAGDLVAAAGGPGGPLDARRQNLSTYTWGHWGDLDPAGDGPKEASVVTILERGLELVDGAEGRVTGDVLDLGCGVGRTTLELARVTDGLVLGIDLNVSFLRAASRILRTGEVVYDLRREGVSYDRRAFAVPVDGAERVDVWCADVAVLPFQAGGFGLVTSLNLIDCIQDPRTHLQSLHDLLVPGGFAIFSSPFDWNAGATDPGAWLGGRTDPDHADGHRTVRRLLAGGDDAIDGLEIVGEAQGLPWDVRLHARSTMRYLVDLFVVRRTDDA